MSNIPRALLQALGQLPLTAIQQDQAHAIIRDWLAYTRDNNVPEEPFAVRYHVPRFAEKEFGADRQSEPLLEVPLSTITVNGSSYSEILSNKTTPEILTDPEFAIVGGATRLALKMYAGININSELPINDIDAVIASDAANIAEKAARYGVDLSGAKIIDGRIDEKLGELVTNFDCTMNQVAIYGDKLLFTQTALNDIKEGNIRLIAKNDPLFGSEGVVLPDGNVYLYRNGFYRGLGFLIRGKGQKLIVSQENIDQEKVNIGRYWQVLLKVKILPIEDEVARYRAIGNWHEIAKRMGSTQSASPKDFFEELMQEYPETTAGRRAEYNNNAQARWIIGRLIGRGVEELYEPKVVALPETYTPADLSLDSSFPDYNFDEFVDIVGKPLQR